MMDLEDMIKSARPIRERGWSEGSRGKRVLASVLASATSPGTAMPRPASRRRWALPALAAGFGAVAVTGVAGAAVVVFAPEPPPDWRVPNNSVACAAERSKNADLSIRSWRVGDDPVDICRMDWISRTGTAPETLFSCVFNMDGTGGAVIVIPGDNIDTAAEACGSVGMFVAPANLTPAVPDTFTPSRSAQGGGV